MSDAPQKRTPLPLMVFGWACLAAMTLKEWFFEPEPLLGLAAVIFFVAADIRAEIREARHDR